jgi:hypothetical protein
MVKAKSYEKNVIFRFQENLLASNDYDFSYLLVPMINSY